MYCTKYKNKLKNVFGMTFSKQVELKKKKKLHNVIANSDHFKLMDRSLKDQDKERILGNINIISKDKCKSVCPDTINSPG